VHLAGRAAGDGEVLAGEVHRRPSTDAAPVTTPSAGRSLPGHAEERGAVLGEQAGLLEAAGVDERVDALARRQLALARCLSSLSAPPPSITRSRRLFNWSILVCICHRLAWSSERAGERRYAGAT
jgi:hypothetical protein